MTPRQSVDAACARVGVSGVVTLCVAILGGEEVDPAFLLVIGGPGARNVLDGREGGVTGCWPRTWALRALLYAWDEQASAMVLAATTDEHWRVREMAAKVIAKHQLDEGLEAVGHLRADPVPRVRAAAARAQRRLTE